MQSRAMAIIGNSTVTSLFNNTQSLQNISNEVKHDIHLSSTVKVVSTIFLSIIIAVSFFGNVTTLILFASFRKLRTINCYFIISLCISDLITTFSSLPFMISLIQTGWPRREDGAAYVLWICIDIFCGCMSIVNLTLVSVERYIFIVHPLHYETIITRRRGIIMIASSGVYSLATAIFGFIRMSQSLPFMIIFVLFAAYVVPVAIMSYTHWNMFLVVRKHCKFDAEQARHRKRLNAMEMIDLNFTDPITDSRRRRRKERKRSEYANTSFHAANGSECTDEIQAASVKGYGFLKKPMIVEANEEKTTRERLLDDGVDEWNKYVDSITGIKNQTDQDPGQPKEIAENNLDDDPEAIVPAKIEEEFCEGSKSSAKYPKSCLSEEPDEAPVEYCLRRAKGDGKINRRYRFKFLTHSELQATKGVGKIIGMFLLLWTPFMMVVALSYLKVQVEFSVALLVKCIHYSSIAINPILYAITNRQFRGALRKLLRNFRRH